MNIIGIIMNIFNFPINLLKSIFQKNNGNTYTFIKNQGQMNNAKISDNKIEIKQSGKKH